METSKNTILVPFDFTEIANNAVEHAILVSKQLDADILLLHIVKKDTMVSEQEKQLMERAESIKSKWGVLPKTLVREGTIFKTINEVVEELNCLLVVMGTHGMKGLQKLTGSWALKVIVGSQIPYLVVQAPPKHDQYNKVVFPIDYKTENKEKLKWVDFINKMFDTKTHIFATASKEGILDSRTKANVVFSKRFMEEKNIDYELTLSEGESSFSQETIQYAEKIDADMVLIMTTRDISFHDYVLGAYEQYIIANNSQIPVLVINPRTDLMKYGYGGFG
ncbi:universal stress protein [Carboxylicivirga linearis]|uniref:Universal stress protein n=1 Tax=Carboxylicivirga linearis TaxID=1628157 RepID=A0ABS5JPX7_9BACT|nr:universal stress protein [Carboxylicivirga linearis]MBS2096940.1 universal stress protein [Carboxylicivirga linearis]